MPSPSGSGPRGLGSLDRQQPRPEAGPRVNARVAGRAVSLFDYNVFGGESSLRAIVGGASVEAAAWMKVHMPHSRVLPGLELEGGDLARVVGFSPVDAGTPVEGVSFRGAAPDIGVAER